MTVTPLLAKAWLCLCLSLMLVVRAGAQEPVSVEVKIGGSSGVSKDSKELPRYQAGLEVGRPVALPLGMIRDWKRPLPLEGVFQRRIGGKPFYAQLYGGYFQGSLHYENGSKLHYKAYYLKPGVMLAAKNKGLRHSFTLEGNLLLSIGRVKGENNFYGPVYGNYEVEARLPITSFGAEVGVGTELVRVGPYKLKALLRTYLCTIAEPGVFYIPGAGYTSFLGVGVGANFYLLRAWGH